jgi:hypothetical protein
VSSERFVLSRSWRLLLSGMIFLPHLVPLAYESWRPTPEEFRHLPGTWGLPLGAWPFLIAVEGVVLAGLMWLFQTKVTIVVVSAEGVTMDRIWRLRWEEVTSARLQTIFGLQYLRVARPGWMRPNLSLPLYMVGSRPLIAALRDHAPLGNPVRKCLDAALAGSPPAS